jgi:hypothetical protein
VTITVAVPYYRNPGMLRLQLETWNSYPPEGRDRFRFIVVDDCSPEPAEPVIREHKCDVRVELYRVEVDKPWAWDVARNIAMHHAPDGWCLITDIDHLLTAENAERLAYGKLKPGKFYTPGRRRAVDGQPYRPHPNSFVLERSLFWEAGGYQEDFAGYYGKDAAFNRQLDSVGERRHWPELELLLYGREVIPDASTSTLGRKGSEYDLALNPELRRMKKRTHIDKPTRHLTLPYSRIL